MELEGECELVAELVALVLPVSLDVEEEVEEDLLCWEAAPGGGPPRKGYVRPPLRRKVIPELSTKISSTSSELTWEVS